MKKILKKILPSIIIDFIKKKIPNQQNKFLKNLNFSYLDNISYIGSEYGGWSFLNKNLENKFIISAGLGEDASFDIELINKYNCKVIIVDPTPRAINHYKQIIKNSGSQKKIEYQDGGKQDISSYDLVNVNSENLILISKGLYNSNDEELKFFAPPDTKHVSHSINDWQNDYKKKSSFIKIKTITVDNILKKFNLKSLELIKLDIEGSEIEVLGQMLEKKIYPNQILVEFDELNKMNKIAVQRFWSIHQKLILENYNLIKTKSKFPDFLYVKN